MKGEEKTFDGTAMKAGFIDEGYLRLKRTETKGLTLVQKDQKRGCDGLINSWKLKEE